MSTGCQLTWTLRLAASRVYQTSGRSRLYATIRTDARQAAGSLTEIDESMSWPVFQRNRSPSGDREDRGIEIPRLPPKVWQSTVNNDDFHFTAEDHETLLDTVFMEARSSILITSAFANSMRLESLRDRIEAALSRGVNIDLIWGYTTSNTRKQDSLLDWLGKAAYRAQRNGQGVLRFNREASNSHGKILLWDGPVRVAACVGSYNWLSTLVVEAKSSLRRNVTLRVSEPAIVAAIARCAAGYWSAVESEVLSSTADRWRRIAADLEMGASCEDVRVTNSRVRLVLDREHESLVQHWTKTAQSRLFVASHKLGAVSRIRLVNSDAARPGDFDFKVMYGETGESPRRLEDVAGLVLENGGVLKCVPGFHREGFDMRCVRLCNKL